MVPLTGLVLTGPPGRAVGVVVRSQVAAQVALFPQGDTVLALHDAAIARFLGGQSIAPELALPESLRRLLQSLEALAYLPLARELWSADAASLLGRVQVPVLVIIGKKDIQVDWEVDGARLAQAAEGHMNVSLYFPDNANHVLKHEPKARTQLAAGEVAQGYNAVDARLDPETLDAIVVWLSAHSA